MPADDAAQKPLNSRAYRLLLKMFNSYKATIKSTGETSDAHLRDMEDFIKNHNNGADLSQEDAEVLLRKWTDRPKASASAAAAPARPAAAPARPAAAAPKHAPAGPLPDALREILPAHSGITSVEAFKATMQASLADAAARTNKIARFENGKKTLCWRDSEGNTLTGRVLHRVSGADYVQCDTGGAVVLSSRTLTLNQVLSTTYWRGYAAAKVVDTETLIHNRKMMQYISEHHAALADKPLYRLTTKMWSHIPFQNAILYVPWVCPERPTENTTKKWTAWVKQADNLRDWFADTSNKLQIGANKTKIALSELKQPKLLLIAHNGNVKGHDVICMDAVSKSGFVGFLGGEWTDDATHHLKVKMGKNKMRYVNFQSQCNLVSFINRVKDSATRAHKQKVNVRLTVKTTPGLVGGKVVVAIATKDISKGDALYFNFDFGYRAPKDADDEDAGADDDDDDDEGSADERRDASPVRRSRSRVRRIESSDDEEAVAEEEEISDKTKKKKKKKKSSDAAEEEVRSESETREKTKKKKKRRSAEEDD